MGESSSTCARTTISASPTIPPSARPRTARSTGTAMAWRPSASSAAPRRCTSSSKTRSAGFSGWKTPSSIHPVSTPTAGSSKRCSARKTRSFPTRSTTRASSTASGSARRSDSVMPTATWRAGGETASSGGRRTPAFKLIATDGVFSMDGVHRASCLKEICELATKYDALVMVDDSHATGFLGAHGSRHARTLRVMGAIDILTGTLGKALGGGSGGWLYGGTQRDRRLVAPAVATLPVLEQRPAGDRGHVAARARPDCIGRRAAYDIAAQHGTISAAA
jgi:hypothetical protein